MDLWDHLDAHRGRFIAKIDTYPPAHHRHLARYQGTPVTFLEIGIFAGGSLEVWRSYLGPDARIAGIDINPDCKALEADGFDVFIGDQADPGFLREVAAELGTIDVVSDDGGHWPHQQITSFETLWPQLAEDGVYMVEDTASSYLASWGPARGGGAHPGSFIDFARERVDDLHVWYTDGSRATWPARWSRWRSTEVW